MPEKLWTATDEDFRLAHKQIRKMFQESENNTMLLVDLAEREALLRAELRFRTNALHPKEKIVRG